MDTLKTRENRLRRVAARNGLMLVKSRSRTPESICYGTFMIVDPVVNAIVHAGEHLSLDEVEAILVPEAELVRE